MNMAAELAQRMKAAALNAKHAGEAPIMHFDERISALKEFQLTACPANVVDLVEALEARDKQIAEDVQIKARLCRESNSLFDRLRAAEKRIAELEARTVKLPEYRNSPDMHTKQFYEAIGFNEGLDAFISALRAAGVAVEGDTNANNN